ncbi:MAG: metallophosphoesterase [Candidatus Gracilibacteria bacterium]|nr:metallophosphoesterase [Candidatus Gracilibacteria bacterium]
MQNYRTIFIGDVQGCYDELKLLIKKLKLKKNDKVYFVGDLINRGPKSYKVLKYLYKNKYRFTSIKGNHELNFLNWLKGEKYSDNKQLKKLKNKIEEHKKNYLIKYIEGLPLFIEEEHFILIHGGLIPNKKLEDHTEQEITNIREFNGKPWYEYYKGNKPIIYGHRAESGLQIRKKTKGLDSGCVYGKALTAYILETGEVIQQNSLECYVDLYKGNNNLFKKVQNIFQKNIGKQKK